MAYNIQLHDNEKILAEVVPQNKLAIYLTVANLWHYICGLFFLFLMVTQILPQNPLTASSNTIMHVLFVNPWLFAALIIPVCFLGNLWSKYMVGQHKYIITNQRIINYSGYWGINCKIIPFERIVDVDFRQNPLQGFLGITSVFIGEQNFAMNMSNSRNRVLNANILMGLLPDQAQEVAHIISSKISGRYTHND